MKRIALILLSAICLFTFISCDMVNIIGETEQEDIDAYRADIINGNISIQDTDITAGRTWLEKYSDTVFNVGMSETGYDSLFKTDKLVSGKEVCFSVWNTVFYDKREAKILIIEVLDGVDRYLSDMYELTGVVKLATVDYAYSRLKQDKRFEALCNGEIVNECGDDAVCYSITEAIPQSEKYTLLVDECLKDGKIYYGSYNDDGLTYDVNITADILLNRGIGNAITRNNTFTRSESLVYLMNKSYKVMYSEETGDLVTVNRKLDEMLLCEKIDSEGDDRLIPEIFGSYDDQVLVFTMRGRDDVVRGYGIYDSATQAVTKYEDGNCPIALYDGILYNIYSDSGVKKIGYTDLLHPELGITPLGDINTVAGVKNGDVKVTVSDDGKKLALAETDTEGYTHIRIYSANNGSLIKESVIKGNFCKPKYVGFLDSDSVFVLCDKYLLCDDYLFIIPDGEENGEAE